MSAASFATVAGPQVAASATTATIVGVGGLTVDAVIAKANHVVRAPIKGSVTCAPINRRCRIGHADDDRDRNADPDHDTVLHFEETDSIHPLTARVPHLSENPAWKRNPHDSRGSPRRV